MRGIRRTAVVGAAMALLLGAGAGSANAAVKGYAENSLGLLEFHASGSAVKGSGGFLLTQVGSVPIAGKVDCYWQSEDGTSATFVATTTKPKSQPTTVYTFWLQDDPDAYSYKTSLAGTSAASLCNEDYLNNPPGETLVPVTEGSSLEIR